MLQKIRFFSIALLLSKQLHKSLSKEVSVSSSLKIRRELNAEVTTFAFVCFYLQPSFSGVFGETQKLLLKSVSKPRTSICKLRKIQKNSKYKENKLVSESVIKQTQTI